MDFTAPRKGPFTYFVNTLCVVGCNEMGGALPTVTAQAPQEMTMKCLFVLVGTTHGDALYSINKQENNILNLTHS